MYTEFPKLEDDAPSPISDPPPTAQWGNGIDLIFGTNASLVMTTGAIQAIFVFPPQSWEIGVKLPFRQQKSKSVFS